MSIRVEFYGIPRSRTGVESAKIDIGDDGAPFSQVLAELATQFPEFAADCLCNAALRKEYTASIDGERFVNDPSELLHPGASLLIMSTDAGG
jgi:molybdopterin converting factor small subunit